jgi:hypothetical protein
VCGCRANLLKGTGRSVVPVRPGVWEPGMERGSLVPVCCGLVLALVRCDSSRQVCHGCHYLNPGCRWTLARVQIGGCRFAAWRSLGCSGYPWRRGTAVLGCRQEFWLWARGDFVLHQGQAICCLEQAVSCCGCFGALKVLG